MTAWVAHYTPEHQMFRETCRRFFEKGSTAAPVTTGKVNGYESASILLRCPLLASTGKPETTMLEVIKGNDSFYVVQCAVRSVPPPERLETMNKYIESVSVCDSRSQTSPCPTVK